MRTLIAAAFVTLSLLSTAAGAQAASHVSYYSDYPAWAQRAFDTQG